jgi:hypothetical protein
MTIATILDRQQHLNRKVRFRGIASHSIHFLHGFPGPLYGDYDHFKRFSMETHTFLKTRREGTETRH